MKISLAFHIVGMVMWVGGLMILTRVLKVFSDELGDSRSLAAMVQGLYKGFVLPGLLVAIVSGLYQLTSMGIGVYMKQGWFHGKLTLVVVLLVVTFFVGGEVHKVQRAQKLSAARLIALHALSSVALLGIVFLTILGR